MARGPNVLLALISFFKNKLLSKAISGTTEPIFTKFLPYGRYLVVDCRFDPFPVSQVMLPWQPILGWQNRTIHPDTLKQIAISPF